ncbi:MAG: cell division protein SepF [Clostridia bacterium]|nr:cell division protein SepF [Clostridia bacterium]
MGMMDKFRGWMGVDDDYDEEYEYIEEKEVPAPSRKRAAKEIKEKESVVMDNPYMGDVEVTKRSNKVVNIAATTQLSVVLVKPERFEDATAIADHLRGKRTVVLNLESTSKEISRRLVDFLSGVAYAKEGQIKRVANCTFIITPYNVEFEGDIMDELESSGVYF